MSCPSCRSAERHQIAPGYFECDGLISDVMTTMVDDPGHPGMLRPVSSEVSRRCATRYQEDSGVATALCECGTFSVGLCQGCNRPICGDHSQLFEGTRFCNDCWKQKEEERAQQEAQLAEREASLPGRTLSAFLDQITQQGIAGTEDIYENVNARRGRDARRLKRAAQNDHAKRVLGFSTLGMKPRSRRQRRIARAETVAQVESELARRNHRHEVRVARGWSIGSHKIGDSLPATGENVGIPVMGELFLASDGRFIMCQRDPVGYVRKVGIVQDPRIYANNAQLTTALRRHAANIGITLPPE